jgi:hypothetical protein
MASKKETVLRGAKLVKKALASAAAVIPSPEPVTIAKKLQLPNGEKLSAGLKELLAFDGSWIGIEYDDEENEVEGTSLEDVIEEKFGEEAVAAFGEAIELLGEDVVAFAAETDPAACLYVGEVDEAGEYPVLVLSYAGSTAKVGFVPFDVWAAQQLGALEKGGAFGEVPAAYAEIQKALAEANGDGRVVFEPKAGAGSSRDDDEDEDDEDEDGDEGEEEDDGEG